MKDEITFVPAPPSGPAFSHGFIVSRIRWFMIQRIREAMKPSAIAENLAERKHWMFPCGRDPAMRPMKRQVMSPVGIRVIGRQLHSETVASPGTDDRYFCHHCRVSFKKSQNFRGSGNGSCGIADVVAPTGMPGRCYDVRWLRGLEFCEAPNVRSPSLLEAL